MKRFLVLLVLASLLPTAQAADGVELQADPNAKELAVTAQSGQDVQATVSYTLQLAAAMPLKLLSRAADGTGAGILHNATWRIDGEAVGNTSESKTLTIKTTPPGSHTVVLVWSVGPKASGTLQLQALVRQDVSGSAGSASGTSAAAVAATTLKVERSGQAPAGAGAATAGSATPVVFSFAYDRRADGLTVSWATSVPATGAFVLTGPNGNAQRSVPLGVRASVDLGNLPEGTYSYNVTARDEAGRTGYLAGSVRIDGLGSGVPVATPLVLALSSSLHESLQPGSVFLVDGDRDGHADRVVDAAGVALQVRGLPQQARFVMQSAGGDGLVLLEANTGNVRPVQAVAGTLGTDTLAPGGRQVAVGAGEKSGWILVTVRDPHPGESFVGVQRADGTPLPTESVWRGNGGIQFLDDPAASYTLLYATEPAGGISFGLAAGLLGIGLLVGIGGMLFVRRRVA